MTVKRKSAISSLVLRQCNSLIIVLCSTVCLMAPAAHGQGLPADNFALTKSTLGWGSGTTATDAVPRLELSMAEHSNFASWITPPDESRPPSATTPGLLISTIDRKAHSVSARSNPVSAQSASLTNSESFDLYKSIIDNQKNPRPGFLSWTDLKSIALNPTDHNVTPSSPSLGADTPASEDEPGLQFKPLTQVHLGDYGVPIFLHVTDARECCR